MTENSLVFINKPDDPPTYYSRSQRTTSTPDLAMGTDDVAKTCTWTIEEQLGGSDHKPCILTLHTNNGSQEKKGKPRWNYKKAKWKDFKEDLEIRCKKLPDQGNNLSKKVDNFTQAVLQSAQNAIPRGFRKNCIPGWDNHLQKLNETVCTTRDIMEQIQLIRMSLPTIKQKPSSLKKNCKCNVTAGKKKLNHSTLKKIPTNSDNWLKSLTEMFKRETSRCQNKMES